MRHLGFALLALAALSLASPLAAQTGVTDDRVSLPDGPGSLEGIGDNSEVDPNMGLFSYAVPVEVPEGFDGMTPSMGLSYTSGGGNGVVGVGWGFPTRSIERMTLFGLPEYTLDDEFAGEGEHLVLVREGNPRLYRSRFESGFDRYWWHDAGEGDGGYWRVETSDGNVHFYGASAEGDAVASARVEREGQTFRYLLVESVDSYDHRVRYAYTTGSGDVPLLDEVTWIFTNGDPLHRIALRYEERPDAVVDCDATFCTTLSERLSEMSITSNGTTHTRYVLSYETAAGVSRLVDVRREAADGAIDGVRHGFDYTLAIGDACDGICGTPFVVSMGNVGTAFRSGDATLVDLNVDGLPDLVDSLTIAAPHRIYLNRLNADGTQRFDAPFESALGQQDGFDLSRASVQVLDADGDGRTDLLNAITGQVLMNDGSGDWGALLDLYDDDGGAPNFEDDFSDGELQTLRFFDYDGDRRVDIIKASGSGAGSITQIRANMGAGFESVEGVETLGLGFDTDDLQFADVNGDGLLDAVSVLPTGLAVRTYEGRGAWEPLRDVSAPVTLSASQVDLVDLEDLDGDGFDDLVLVEGSEVRFWRNRNGVSFEDAVTLASADVAGELPARTAETAVLFADMNANGSIDVLWVTPEGEASYLDVFPIRPHLMSEVRNGVGAVTAITYGTAVEHMARAGGPEAWEYRLPMPMNVVDQLDQWDLAGEVHAVQDYRYTDGWYDGVERQLRGFREVVIVRQEGDYVEEAVATLEYDLGDGAPAFAGRLLSREVADGNNLPLRTERWEYESCALDSLPTAVQPREVVFPCLVAEESLLQERTTADAWVRTRDTYAYDAWGHVTLRSELGVVDVGGGACGPCEREAFEYGAPCGATCEGDEEYTEATYSTPDPFGDDPWLLGMTSEELSYAHPDDPDYSGTRYYYDGDAYEGLPLGQATAGFLARTERRVSADDEWIVSARNRADEHGNIVEFVGPLGAPDGETHRQTIEMDDWGMEVVNQELWTTSAEGVPYRLQSQSRSDAVWFEPTLSADWSLVRDGDAAPLNPATQTYDGFGRPSANADAGDSVALATREFDYEFTPEFSAVWTRERSTSGGAFDVQSVACIDGRGRTWMARSLQSDGSWLVTNVEVYTPGGEEAFRYIPWTSDTSDCVLDAPTDAVRVETTYDALDRPLTIRWADVDGRLRESRFEYRPGVTVSYDNEDQANGDAPHADTPTTSVYDGRGRMVQTTRAITPTEGHTYAFTWHGTGKLARVIDPLGNERVQRYDPMGRPIEIVDPNRGTTTYVYDDAGNLVREVDGRGIVTLRAFDGLNRLVERWTEGQRDDTLVTYHHDDPAPCPTGGCKNTAGRAVGVTYPGGAEWFGYNARGQIDYFAREIDGTLFEFSTSFDNLGRMTSVTYPTGDVITFEVDTLGRTRAVPGYVDAVLYDERGDVIGVDLTNGTSTRYGVNEAREIVAVQATNGAGEPIHDVQIERDREGNVVAIDDMRPADAPLRNDATFTYDAYYRLIEAAIAPNAGEVETLTYDYDASDNILRRSSSTPEVSGALLGDYSYAGPRPHAVTSVGDLSFGYDSGGFITSRGADAYAWDTRGRLTSVTRDGAEIAAFAYTHSTDRSRALEDDVLTYFPAPGFQVEDGVATIHVELGDEHIADLETGELATAVLSDLASIGGGSDGEISAGDAWLSFASEQGFVELDEGDNVSASGRLLAGSASLGLLDRGERKTWMHRDHMDTVVAVTDEDGEVVERTLRYPFGAELATTSNNPVERSFAGEHTSRTTGLVYFGARYYDPELGRFISPDPYFILIEPEHLDQAWEAMNPYAYGWNNPQTLTDDDGNFVFNPITAVVGAATSFVFEVWTRALRNEPMNPFTGAGLKTWGKIAGWAILGGVAGGLSQGLSIASFGVRYGAELAGHYSSGSSQRRQKIRSGIDRTSGALATAGYAAGAVVSFLSGDVVGALSYTASAIDQGAQLVTGRSLIDRTTGYAKPDAYDQYDVRPNPEFNVQYVSENDDPVDTQGAYSGLGDVGGDSIARPPLPNPQGNGGNAELSRSIRPYRTRAEVSAGNDGSQGRARSNSQISQSHFDL